MKIMIIIMIIIIIKNNNKLILVHVNSLQKKTWEGGGAAR
jgi:hypothetical protein